MERVVSKKSSQLGKGLTVGHHVISNISSDANLGIIPSPSSLSRPVAKAPDVRMRGERWGLG